MSWLVSFLNVGPRVASPNDNYLLFGANCKETDEVVVHFVTSLQRNVLKLNNVPILLVM